MTVEPSADEAARQALAVLARMGTEEAGADVFRDAAIEIRRAGGRTIVRRLRTGATILRVLADGTAEGTAHEEIVFVADHLAALAQECRDEEAAEEQATTPLRAEDVEAMLASRPDRRTAVDDGHAHADFLPECHPAAAGAVYYCEGVLHIDCAACHRPVAAFLVASRTDEPPPERAAPSKAGYH